MKDRDRVLLYVFNNGMQSTTVAGLKKGREQGGKRNERAAING